MDNQRLFPLLALMVVLFLIWEHWLDFQARKHPPPAVSPPAATGTPAPAAGGAESAPGQDIPGAPAPVTAPGASAGLESGQRVRVTTDVFVAEIDTLGGDLRHVGLRTYPASVEHRDEPLVVLRDGSSELFVLQSGLVSAHGSAPNHYARFTAEKTEYRLEDGQDRLDVRLTWTADSGLRVTKTYGFQRGRFAVDLIQRVENATAATWQGSQYRQLQRTPPPEQGGGMFGGVYTYTGGVISTPEKPYEKIPFDSISSWAKEKKDLEQTVKDGWIAMIQHYFLAALIPPPGQTDTFYTRMLDGNRFILGMRGPLQTLEPGQSHDFATVVYVGPKIQDRLEAIAPHLSLTVDYGYFTIIAKPLFWLLSWIEAVVGNWGWAIIILTLLIKGAFFKLSETSYRSMAHMKQVAPKINALKERYGDDKQRLNQAMMDLYKQEKINPLGGCLPILVQIPVFIALYWMLVESVELRQAPWILWIQDLALKDPYYILPLIMGATMFLQQKMSPAPPDPMQAKVMMLLPILFTFMFLWFPAGLVLYWVVNNVVSIAQQYVITKRIEEDDARRAKGSSAK